MKRQPGLSKRPWRVCWTARRGRRACPASFATFSAVVRYKSWESRISVSNGTQRTKVKTRPDSGRRSSGDWRAKTGAPGRQGRKRCKGKKEEETKRKGTHIPLEHDLPPLDLFVPQPRPFLQLLPRLAPPRRRIARKHARLAEVSRFEDEDRGGVVACREGGGGGCARGGGL